MNPTLVVTFTAPRKAELLPEPADERPLAGDEVAGPTLVTLTSPGTELNWGFMGSKFPAKPGYAAVFRVEQVGPEVRTLAPGDMALCMGSHRSYQRRPQRDTVPVPAGLAPHLAVYARLMGVSMTTLMTTAARPGDRVLVTGLGPVGNLAMQLFKASGYEVIGVEPNPARRKLAESVGLGPVLESTPTGDAAFAGSVALAVECSGHEQAALDGCRVVRKGGEVVLIGVPWQRRSETLTAFDILHAVFHRYIVLRSGWEWEVPNQPSDFRPHSIFGGLATALRWLAEGKVHVDRLCELSSPRDCQAVYDQLLRGERMTAVFDWRCV
ncbi:MAG: zinc-binding alcohol dehydrogenase [Phycisphaerae bacterium]|nr:zinc-binding alcohol dehydrogenase [Phycisphaerae bacterium]